MAAKKTDNPANKKTNEQKSDKKSTGVSFSINTLLDLVRKKKGTAGQPGTAPKNACPECDTGFMPWISYCTKCKIPLKG